MWGFFILITVYIEAYGALFDPHFAIPLVGHWNALGFLQDFIALAVLAASSPSRSSGCARAEGNTGGPHGSTAHTPVAPG